MRAEVEQLRRRLYARGGGDEDAVEAFARKARLQPPVLPQESSSAPLPTRSASDREAVRVSAVLDRRGARRRLVLLGGTVVCIVIALVAWLTAAPARPTHVAAPSMPGTTLLSYERPADPGVGPRAVTYQPEGYVVHQPAGRYVAVGLRCAGRGSVQISAGARFRFRCGDGIRTLRLRTARPVDRAFVIVGETVGDVVWAARIVVLAPPTAAGSVPQLQPPCTGCTVAQG